GDDETLNELGDLGADHVSADELARLRIEDRLDEALVLAQRNGLAVAEEREAADLDVAALRLRLRFRQTDGGNLRLAIGAARYLVLVHRMSIEALDLLDADDALMLCLVRQHRRACYIADRIDARHTCAAEAIDNDDAFVGLDAERLEAEILDIAGDADRRDHP